MMGTIGSAGSASSSTGTPIVGSAASSSASSLSRARCSVRKTRHSGSTLPLFCPQTCRLTCSPGDSGPPRLLSQASRARAIQGVQRHMSCALSGPTTGAASSQSRMLTEPGPTPASSTTAFTRPGARLAAWSATPPAQE
jgi:hypothetical protein